MDAPQTRGPASLLAKHAPAGVLVVSPDGRVVAVDAEAGRLLGRSAEQLMNQTLDGAGLSFVRQDGSPMPAAEWPSRAAGAGGAPVGDVIVGLDRADAAERTWLLVGAFPEHEQGAEAGQTVVTLVDVTSLMVRETRPHLTEALRALRNVNRLLVREKDRDRMIAKACGVLTETRGYLSAWIALKDANGRFYPAAQSGVGSLWGGLQAFMGEDHVPACCRGLASRAGSVSIANPAADCRDCPLTGSHERAGAIAAALSNEGIVYGTLVVALPAELLDDPDERSLFEEIASDIGFALHAMARDEQRRQAELSLKRSEELYRGLFERMINGITHCRMIFEDGQPVDWVYLTVNQAFETLTGLHDVIGKRVSEVIPGIRESGPRLFEFYGRVASTGEPDKMEVFVEGLQMWFEVSAYSLGESDFAAVFDVITARKRVEAALRDSEQRFRTLVETAPVAIFVRTKDRFGYLNQAAVRLFGAESAEQLIGQPVLERIRPDYRERVAGRIRAHDEEGEVVLPEERVMLRLDGSEVPVMIAVAALGYRGEANALVFAQDFSEQERVLDELRESEERFRALADSGPDGIFIQTEGRFRYLNRTMAKILGQEEPEPLLGTEVIRLVPAEEVEAVRARTRLRLEPGEAIPSMDHDFVRADGSRVPTETSAVGFRFQGAPAHLVFVRDRTQRRKEEAERSNLQEQLIQAQKMESIGQLAGGVAHDFNNILMVQKGYCELMKLGLAEGDPLRDSVTTIEDYAERATQLTRQLLAFSRKQTLQPVVLDLNELVRNMTDMLRRLIGEEIELVTACSPSPALVMADPGQLEQVLVNLAVNARDAMFDAGTLSVSVAEVALSEAGTKRNVELLPGPYVVLSVADTGSGMDAATVRRIFEPFFTTKAEGRGTGLGLSTVYGIVRQSGGSIQVESEPGKGATFKVYLPRVEEAPVASNPKTTRTLTGNGELVLLVEDEQALRTLALLMLTQLGYQAIEAANGSEALELVAERGLRPDVLLTDVVLPGMSGGVLADRLREVVPDVKVVFMSGYPDETIAKRGVLGADVKFLQKPFSMSDLSARLRSALGG